MRRARLFAGVIFILAVVAAGTLAWRRRAAPQPGQASKAEPVAHDVKLAGTIQARHVVPVGAAVAGTIDSILVDAGQDVYEGQMLAHIGSQELESARREAARDAQNAQDRFHSVEGRILAARLEAARCRADAGRSRDQFDRAEKAYLRQQMLHREGATPRLVYEKSEREFEMARSESASRDELARQAESRVSDLTHEHETARRILDQRNAELEDATRQSSGADVRSPVSGILIAHKGEPGKTISEEEAKDLFEVAVDLAQLMVAVRPDQAQLKRIHPGLDALIFVADLPGATPGSVQQIRGNEVMIEFASPSPAIRPGMTAEVRLRLE